MNAKETIIERTSQLCYGIAAVSLVGIVVLMILRILSRNFDLGLGGLQLYAQALGVWMVFIVAGVLELEDRHIDIDYVTARLPESVGPYVEIVIGTLSFVMCALLVVGGLLATETYWRGTSPSVNIPMPLYYLPLVVGMSMLGLAYAGTVVDQVRALAGREGE